MTKSVSNQDDQYIFAFNSGGALSNYDGYNITSTGSMTNPKKKNDSADINSNTINSNTLKTDELIVNKINIKYFYAGTMNVGGISLPLVKSISNTLKAYTNLNLTTYLSQDIISNYLCILPEYSIIFYDNSVSPIMISNNGSDVLYNLIPVLKSCYKIDLLKNSVLIE